jgi:D-aspartate ligase
VSAPVLLSAADSLGTLAAVRCLGRRGVRVSVADTRRLAPALWSRHTTCAVRCPPVGRVGALVDWLVGFGRDHPGHVLYPCSDDLAWIYARHADRLSSHFRLWQPPLAVMERLLSKRLLAQAAQEAGLSVPRTFWAAREEDLGPIAAEARFPLLIKPQTQVLFEPHMKGRLVRNQEELIRAWRSFREAAHHAPELAAVQPDVSLPILQAYSASSSRGVYTMTGFVDETGELFVAAASRKVLQWPRLLGVGICFEEASLLPEVAAKVRALCREVGYFGAFEVEFLEDDGAHALIDFNPRFYGEMALEVDRGLPLPWLVYLAALGRRDELRREVEQARAAANLTGRIYYHRTRFKAMLFLQRLSGAMSRDEVDRWLAWLAAHRGRVTDPVSDPEDRRPAYFDVAIAVAAYLRHPRAFLRQIVLGRVSEA